MAASMGSSVRDRTWKRLVGALAGSSQGIAAQKGARRVAGGSVDADDGMAPNGMAPNGMAPKASSRQPEEWLHRLVVSASRPLYRAQQRSAALSFGLSHQALRRGGGYAAHIARVMKRERADGPGATPGPKPSRTELVALGTRYRALVEDDLHHAERGLYPMSLLFERPLRHYLQQLPHFVVELGRNMRRRARGAYQELPDVAREGDFPAYYRRNFHWQSDGYFSEKSAALYDQSVDFLFLGAADAMRRQSLAALRIHLSPGPNAGPDTATSAATSAVPPMRVLDLACGTGRFLTQCARACPTWSFCGVDLSPAYVAYANAKRQAPNLRFIQANAEDLPEEDAYYDAITCIYLMHELPKTARSQVLREAKRVLKPGGLLVVQDSLQHHDGQDVGFFLEQFAADFHEPFYRDYLKQELEKLLVAEGFELVTTRSAYVSKIVVARRPSL